MCGMSANTFIKPKAWQEIQAEKKRFDRSNNPTSKKRARRIELEARLHEEFLKGKENGI